ncbi:hypothetical protein MHK_009852 [Candidatus Magnetomorum sp. HK-1]|nr:hypothetical protein MHK_009852 [Candidatus Magnetomorum sp. HK-1]
MNQLFNDSEKLVFDICKDSFLSFWSYSNPLGKKSKELCDILVVCDPDIIIISVKDIKVTNSGNIETDWKRWQKKAIDASAKQIYGAERWLNSVSNVIKSDGSIGIKLPQLEQRRIHRVAIALGNKGKTSIKFGDLGNGFVHVFDDISLNIVMIELNTISDFVNYLLAKENLYTSGRKTLFQGGEEDLLAIYLHNGRQFPKEFKNLIIGDDLWEDFIEKDVYNAKQNEDEISYVWDKIIEIISKDVLDGNLEFGPELNESEIALRIMAQENRFGRRILGKTFMEFYELVRERKIQARMAASYSNTIYVFLGMDHDVPRDYRKAVLAGRCLVARGIYKNCKTVIGIATERYEDGKGYSFDLMCMYIPKWTEDFQKQFEYLQNEFGYFKNSIYSNSHEDEYPQE